MAITLLTNLPNRSQDAATYVTNANNFMAALPVMGAQMNTLAGNLNSIAAGGAYAMPYSFVASTNIGSAGGGGVGLIDITNQTTQTSLYIDTKDVAGLAEGSMLDSISTSSSTIKGYIRLVKTSDPSKWLAFSFTYMTTPTAYYKLFNVVCVGSSSANPFVYGDSVMVFFQRTGDVGGTGTITRRSTVVASNSAPAPNMVTTDIYIMTAQAAAITFGAPTGSPTEGQTLMYRVKDNGTARALAYNAVYRASVDLPFPSTTVPGKNLYIGFSYNANDGFWDLIAVLNNL